jgi:hypothetical protein
MEGLKTSKHGQVVDLGASKAKLLRRRKCRRKVFPSGVEEIQRTNVARDNRHCDEKNHAEHDMPF